MIYLYSGSNEITRQFIRLRADKHHSIAKKGHAAVYQWVTLAIPCLAYVDCALWLKKVIVNNWKFLSLR